MEIVRLEIVHNLLVLLHLLGFASLFGGLVVQARASDPEVNAAMLHGALTALVTGVLLVGWIETAGERPDYLKLGIKLGLTLLLVILVVVNRRFTSIPKGLWGLLGVLTLATVSVAVLWPE